ncbi:MAG: SLC13 family permease [Egibacteraceae bacterium]
MLDLLAVVITLSTLGLIIIRPGGAPEWVYAVTGLGALAALGRVPLSEAVHTLSRTGPVLVFLLAVTVLADAVERVGLFDALALTAGRAARNSGQRLLAGILLVAFLVTTVLSLDATAVLLTPAVVAVIRLTRAPALPLVLGTVYVANAGSLLLPVSNLTNLLAANRLRGGLGLAAAMWPAQLAVLLMLWGLLAWWHRRALRRPLSADLPAPTTAITDHRAAAVCAGATIALLPAFLLTHGWPLAGSTVAAAAVACAFTDPRRTRIPWGVGAFVAALFVLVDAASAGPLGAFAQAAVHGAGPVRAGLVGAVAANVLNNLPAFLLLAPGVANGAPLRGLLAGVNIGANLSMIGSLATLLWLACLRPKGMAPSPLQFLKWGLVVTPLTLLPALALLTLIR